MNKLEYEVYYPFSLNNFTKLDLSICSKKDIFIYILSNIPLSNINKYNQSSEIYNDICYSSTDASGADKPLKDRQDDYVNNNLSICEENCNFIDYDNINKKAVCSCPIKLNLPLIFEISIDKKKLFANFKNINNIANIKLLKCFYLLLNMNNIIKNSANYILVTLFILSIIGLFIFRCKDYININNIINEIIKQKKSSINNNNKTTLNVINNKKKNSIITRRLIKNKNNKFSNNKFNMKWRRNKLVNIKNKRINNINKNIVTNNSLLIQKSKNILNKNYTNDKIINSTLNKKRTKSIVITNSKKLKFKNGKLNLKNKVQKNECYNDN